MIGAGVAKPIQSNPTHDAYRAGRGLKQFHECRDQAHLAEHQGDDPLDEIDLGACRLGAQRLDIELEIGSNLLDLSLQMQLRFAHMALGGEITQVRIALFQPLEGLGNLTRARSSGALVKRFVECDAGGHGSNVPPKLRLSKGCVGLKSDPQLGNGSGTQKNRTPCGIRSMASRLGARCPVGFVI